MRVDNQKHYSRKEGLDVVGMQSSGDGKNFQSTICSILGEIDVVCDSNNMKISIGLREAEPLSNLVVERSLQKF